MRLFIAVPLPTELTDRAAALLPPALPALKPVRPELMHITLAFLGWTPDDRLDDVVGAAREATAGHHSFDLATAGAGRFPGSGRLRVVWLGIGAGSEPLSALAADVARALRAGNLTFEDRPFAPHLTLARLRVDASAPEWRTVAAAIDGLEVPELRTRVDRIAVVESVVSPKGPRYTVRAELPLS
ncbi:MAG: RNA 2',3'-cyclic phosphodiesterase [Chloroflexota bacterium]|nr:RNA 2',3'-cyclic phosphodiesterase [Chloroflexota bacterium]